MWMCTTRENQYYTWVPKCHRCDWSACLSLRMCVCVCSKWCRMLKSWVELPSPLVHTFESFEYFFSTMLHRFPMALSNCVCESARRKWERTLSNCQTRFPLLLLRCSSLYFLIFSFFLYLFFRLCFRQTQMFLSFVWAVLLHGVYVCVARPISIRRRYSNRNMRLWYTLLLL